MFSSFATSPWISKFYTRNEAHNQYSLLDSMLNYVVYFGHPGHLLYYASQEHFLPVGRRGNVFWGVKYRCLFGGLELNKNKYCIQYTIQHVWYKSETSKKISAAVGQWSSLLFWGFRVQLGLQVHVPGDDDGQEWKRTISHTTTIFEWQNVLKEATVPALAHIKGLPGEPFLADLSRASMHLCTTASAFATLRKTCHPALTGTTRKSSGH